MKLDTLNASFWYKDGFPGAIINKDPLFLDITRWDMRPDTLSPLLNNGNPDFSQIYPSDIRGVSRLLDALPDIGAYERVPGERRKVKK
jgi:hypothetical protein